MSTFNHNDKFLITSGGNVVINGQSTDGYFEIRQTNNTASIRLNNGSNPNGAYYDILSNTAGSLLLNRNGSPLHTLSDASGNATFYGTLTVSGTGQSIFGGQVTIPATPVANTDAASKSYVDSQIGSNDTLSEILANGNTTGGTDIAVSAGDDITFTSTSKAIFNGVLEIYHDATDNYCLLYTSPSPRD